MNHYKALLIEWRLTNISDSVGNWHISRRLKMKKLIPILLSALMFTGCAGPSNHQTNTYRSITKDEAVTMMAQETGYIILDVRRPDEFAAGHIPNAINVPNETIGTDEYPTRINLSWCIAEAVGAVKRHRKSWSSWVTRIS